MDVWPEGVSAVNEVWNHYFRADTGRTARPDKVQTFFKANSLQNVERPWLQKLRKQNLETPSKNGLTTEQDGWKAIEDEIPVARA